jgi:hypothetical protein
MARANGERRQTPIPALYLHQSRGFAISLRESIAETRKTATVNSIGKAETSSKENTKMI